MKSISGVAPGRGMGGRRHGAVCLAAIATALAVRYTIPIPPPKGDCRQIKAKVTFSHSNLRLILKLVLFRCLHINEADCPAPEPQGRKLVCRGLRLLNGISSLFSLRQDMSWQLAICGYQLGTTQKHVFVKFVFLFSSCI